MRSLTRHLTPDELRIVWILTAVLLLGIGGRVLIASHPVKPASATEHPSAS